MACAFLAAGLGVALLALVGIGARPAAAATGVVGRSGSQLTVNGQPWTFVGYNLPCTQPFQLSADQLGYYFDGIQSRSGGTVVRMWFFQQSGGPSNWSAFDQVLSVAAAHGMRIVPVLVGGFAGCEPDPSGQPFKPLSWYQQGYKLAGDGYPIAFRDYAVAVAQHYAGNPTVAFWQLVNEAQAETISSTGAQSCQESAAASALRTFADDMAGALHAVDPQHLVSLGTIGTGQCGTAGADYSYVHSGAVDLCEYHDYGAPTQAMPTTLAARISDCTGLPGGPKPLVVGESGIVSNVQSDGSPAACDPWPSCSPDPVSLSTLQRRAQLFGAKIGAAFHAGVAGYLVWVKSPFYTPSTTAYAIGDGDPTEAALRNAFTTSGPTPSSVPEGPLAVLLPFAAIGAAGSWFAFRRWRFNRRS